MINKLRYKARLRSLLRRRRIPVSSTKESAERPIFIVGSGRSGNTLMRRGLVEHGSIVIPPETYVLGAIIRVFLRHNNMGWISFVDYALGTIGLHFEFDDTFGYSLASLRKELVELPPEERSLACFFVKFYRDYADWNQIVASRWGDKTPFNTFSVWEILTVFPKAKFIWMYRDPVDVVASYLKAGRYTSIEAATMRWLESNEILLAFRAANPESCMVVKYDDLVNNYEERVRGVCLFCDLSYRVDSEVQPLGDVEVHAHHSNVLKPVTNKSIGKGYSELEKADIDVIHRITGAFYTQNI